MCIRQPALLPPHHAQGAHLSPAGEYNLRLGVMKEMKPELIATYQGGGDLI